LAFFATKLVTELYWRIGILLACGKHLHDRIISLKGHIWANKTSRIKQAGKRSCVLGVLSCLFLWRFYMILELFWQCGIFLFFFPFYW